MKKNKIENQKEIVILFESHKTKKEEEESINKIEEKKRNKKKNCSREFINRNFEINNKKKKN
jgi:hypothetical protein